MIDPLNFNSIEYIKNEILNISKRSFDIFDDASLYAFDNLTQKLQNTQMSISAILGQ